MKAIVAVYDDWGIGANGTQPVALSADRKFFREMTRGACVIVGRQTLADFPGGRPLPGRENRVLTRDKNRTIPGPFSAEARRRRRKTPRRIRSSSAVAAYTLGCCPIAGRPSSRRSTPPAAAHCP